MYAGTSLVSPPVMCVCTIPTVQCYLCRVVVVCVCGGGGVYCCRYAGTSLVSPPVMCVCTSPTVNLHVLLLFFPFPHAHHSNYCKLSHFGGNQYATSLIIIVDICFQQVLFIAGLLLMHIYLSTCVLVRVCVRACVCVCEYIPTSTIALNLKFLDKLFLRNSKCEGVETLWLHNVL